MLRLIGWIVALALAARLTFLLVDHFTNHITP